MPKYKKLSGTYIEMMQAMGMSEDIYLDPKFTFEKYREQLEKDMWRSRYVSFDKTTAQIQHQIYDPNTYEKTKLFTQGDFYAGYIKSYFMQHKFSEKIAEYALHQENMFIEDVGFSYIDDQGIACGLSIVKIEGNYLDVNDPSPKYAIAIAHNIHATLEERQVSFFCDDDLLQLIQNKQQPALVSEQDIQENNLFKDIESSIGSVKISQLIKGIFTDGVQTLSEEKFHQLSNRIKPSINLDNRDFKLKQLKSLIEVAKKTNSPLASTISTESDASVDFFEDTHYQQVLLAVLSDATKMQQQELITTAEDLYLEYFIVTLMKELGGDETRETFLSGLRDHRLVDIWKEFSKNRDKPIMPYDTFKKKSHQFFKQHLYHEEVNKLENDIHYCHDPLVKNEVSQFVDFFRKQAFTEERLDQQQSLRAFVAALKIFLKDPSIKHYNKLVPLYKEFNFQIPDIEAFVPLEKRPQQAEYDEKIADFKRATDKCKQAFVKEEALIWLQRLKTIKFENYRPQDQDILLDFLTAIENFTNYPSAQTYDKLMPFYPKFASAIPDRDKFLQTQPIAELNYIVSKKIPQPYLFDLQGVMTYDTLDHLNRPVTVSLDIPNDDMQREFHTLLLAALQKDQTIAEKDAESILIAYKNIKNKKNIIALQQQLHAHIETLAQHYQTALADNSFDDQERMALVTETMQAIRPKLMAFFARGLCKAYRKGQTIDSAELNKVLNVASVKLKQKGKDLLCENITKKLSQKHKNHATYDMTQNSQTPSTRLYVNKKFELTTSMTIQNVSAEFSCQQMKVFQMNKAQNIEKEIPRLRLETSALMISANLGTIPFNERFKERLDRIKKTYSFQKPSYTHYLFDGPYEQENNQPDNIALSLSAAHDYNRKNNQSMCFVQAIGLSNEGKRSLGYHMFDWSGIGNEATLMAEMSLCTQITTLDTTAYQKFLQPPQSLLSRIYRSLFKSTLFANTHEGAQTKAQIRALKTTWQTQTTVRTDTLDASGLIKLGLQKLMAFDLHFNQDYAILIQTLSLALQGTEAILNIDAASHSPALVLEYTQALDALYKMPQLKTAIKTLIAADNRETAIASANYLISVLHGLNPSHKEALLPINTDEETSSIKKEAQAIAAKATSINRQLDGVPSYKKPRQTEDSKPSTQASKRVKPRVNKGQDSHDDPDNSARTTYRR
ncbi:MAG: hypothetical protein CK424_00490 [Legionella sp.]|nr:MAG: hypothetical protein CK424_00490 [Legionella sp.]